MNSIIAVSKQTKGLVGLVAIVATVFTCGGTLTLAEHYSRSSMDGRDYLAASQQGVPADLKQASPLKSRLG
ncbi:MAG: hypothetical protein WCV99_11235 [Sterolibacterium sp.]|jgi:hypothetical protein